MRLTTFSFLIVSAMALSLGGCKSQRPHLAILNWDSYVGKGVESAFTKKTGIQIDEKNYSSNEELIEDMKTSKAAIVFPSTYAVDILADQGRLGSLDWSHLSNRDVVPMMFQKLPEARSCIPYTWSAIATFNDQSKGPRIDVATIFDPSLRQRLAGHLMLLDDKRGMLGLALRYQHHSVNSTNEAELDDAVKLLRGVKPETLVFANGFLVDRIASTPQIWAGVSWSGDARWAAEKRTSISVTIPEDSIQYVDWACLTKNATPEATEFLNHLLDPHQALDLLETTRYAPVNDRVESLAPSDVINIVREFEHMSTSLNPEMIRSVGSIGDQKFEDAWLKVKQ